MKLNIFGYQISIDKKFADDAEVPLEVKKAIEILKSYGIKSGSSADQKRAAAKATQAKKDKALEKISTAIFMLEEEDKKLTNYAIAKRSGCSINTIKKYKDFVKEQIEMAQNSPF